MDNLGFWVIEDLPACLTGLEAEIGVFLVGKEPLVQIPDLLNQLTADQHAGAGDARNRAGFVLIQIVELVFAEELAGWK